MSLLGRGYEPAGKGYKPTGKGYVSLLGKAVSLLGKVVSLLGKVLRSLASDTVLIIGGSTEIVATAPMKLPNVGRQGRGRGGVVTL